MADLWRVTYMGDGVKVTSMGAFGKFTTAFTEEAFAKSVAGQEGWIVADPQGKEIGSAPAKKPEEKKPEPEKKAEAKAEEKKPEPEKKAEAKAEEKKPEAEKKADEKKPAEAAAEKKK